MLLHINSYNIINMVITSLQEKENRKFYVPIRPGNRGGWSLFQWQSVREMPYRDREMYLGNSAVIGVLDKGGKWRKRDWYLKTQKKYNDPNLSSEQQQAMKRDMERMNAALGNHDVYDDQKLNEEEMQILLKKIKNKDGELEPPKQAVGLGFDKTKVQIRAKPSTSVGNANRLEGINQLKLEVKQQKKQEKKDKQRQYSQSRSRSQRKKKKDKKEKKEKKHRRSKSKSQEDGKKERNREEQREKHQEKSRERSRDKKHKKEKRKKHKHERHRSSSRD